MNNNVDISGEPELKSTVREGCILNVYESTDKNDECEPFLKVVIKEENGFEEIEEESEKREHCMKLEIKNEQISDEEEEHHEIEVDVGSFLSTEIVKQDPGEEEILQDGSYPSADGNKDVECEKQQFECDICKKTFGLQFLLMAHKRIHSKETLFECEVCKRTFLKKRYLTVHHKYMHARVAPHACDVCDKTFVQLSALKEHKLVHVKEKPFACELCPCWFTRLYALHVHMRTHSGERPYQCDVCPKRFAKSSSLKRHKQTHNEHESSAVECHRSMHQGVKSQSYLSMMRSHIHCSTEKPIHCEYCNRGFSESATLKKHVRHIHSGEKPYECEVCKRKFTRMSGLTKHKAVHVKEKFKE